jgi:hypothetical protein
MPPRKDIRWAIPPRSVLSRPIPKGMSCAADPNLASFLDLPGEIRNYIYALAYHYPDPLVLDSEADQLRLCRGLGDRNGSDLETPNLPISRPRTRSSFNDRRNAGLIHIAHSTVPLGCDLGLAVLSFDLSRSCPAIPSP